MAWFSFAYLKECFAADPFKPAHSGVAKRKNKYLIYLPKAKMYVVKAPTKSEARSILKKDHGLKRLPIGTRISKA